LQGLIQVDRTTWCRSPIEIINIAHDARSYCGDRRPGNMGLWHFPTHLSAECVDPERLVRVVPFLTRSPIAGAIAQALQLFAFPDCG
jgi:hypothetical protein